eukprot:UC1_evm1s1063
MFPQGRTTAASVSMARSSSTATTAVSGGSGGVLKGVILPGTSIPQLRASENISGGGVGLRANAGATTSGDTMLTTMGLGRLPTHGELAAIRAAAAASAIANAGLLSPAKAAANNTGDHRGGGGRGQR